MLYLMIIAGVLLRLAPHPDNVTPLMGVAIFSGFYLRSKYAWILPLLLLFVSDIFIGFYLFPIMIAVYLSFAASGLIGRYAIKRPRSLSIVGATLGSSILSYVVTNLAVWLFAGNYPLNWQGLSQCYLMALPYFRNSLIGNFGYVLLFFALYEWVGRALDAKLHSWLVQRKARVTVR